LLKFPPPPTEPPPPHEPMRFKLPSLNDEYNGKVSGHLNKGMQTSQEWNVKQINALERGGRKEDNAAYAVANKKVPPQKPAPPSLPKVKALYDYEPQDLDELRLKEGDIVEVLKERKLLQSDFICIMNNNKFSSNINKKMYNFLLKYFCH